MAEEKVQIKVNVNGDGQAAKSVSNIKKEIREAQAQAILLARQFGELSPEAQAAAERVAELKDEIADLNERIELADPGAKFKVFSNVLASVAGGFSAIQGAMATFGAESEDLQKTMVKLQGAMALTEGLSTIADSWKDFERLGAVIKTNVVKAFTTLRGAIIATGIGALLVALGLIIANFDKIEAKIKELFPAFEGFGKLFDKVKAIAMGALNAIIESFKIVGDIIADIFKGDFKAAVNEAANAGKRMGNAYVEGFNKEVADQMQEAARKATEALIKQQENDLKVLRAYGATREREAEALELKIAQNKIKVLKDGTEEERAAQAAAFAELQALRIQQAQKEGERQLAALQNRQALELQALTDAGKSTIGVREQQLQQVLALEKRYGLDTKGTVQEILQARAADRKAQFDKELQELQTRQDAELQAATLAGKNVYELRKQQFDAQLELYRKFGIDVKEVQEKQAAEELERRRKLNDALQTTVRDHNAVISTSLENTGAQQSAFNQRIVQSSAEAQVKIDEHEKAKQGLYGATSEALATLAQSSEDSSDLQSGIAAASAAIIAVSESAKQDAFGKTADALKAASSILGEQTAVGKGVAIASTTISTIESAGLAYRNGQMVGGPWGIALGIAAAAAALVAGYARVKQIQKVQIPGTGGAGGTGIGGGSIGMNIPTAAPISVPTVQPNATTLLQAQQQSDQNATRVVVLESDITKTQKRVASIEENAKF